MNNQTYDIPRPRLHFAWIILGMGTLVVFASLGLARFGYSMLLPPMQEALGLDNAQAGGLATANLVGYLLMSVTAGALASRYGPRAVIAAGLAVAALGMLLTGFAQGFAGAAAWRALTGVGSGASNVPVMGLLAAWFAPRRRGLAAGIAVTGSSLALIALGPGVPRILLAYGPSGWRVCWFVFAGASFVLALLGWTFLRNRPSERGLRPLGAEGDAGAAAPGVSALRWSDVWAQRAVWHIALVYAAFGFSYIIYMTFFVKYLISECGYAPLAAGRLFRNMGYMSLVCGLIWGTISDFIGRKWALAIVFGIQAVSFALFALWPSPVAATMSAVLFGVTAWSIPAIMAATCGDLLGSRLAPAGLGFITFFFGLGQAAGPSVAGALADVSGSLSAGLLLASAVALAGGIGSVLLRPASRESRLH